MGGKITGVLPCAGERIDELESVAGRSVGGECEVDGGGFAGLAYHAQGWGRQCGVKAGDGVAGEIIYATEEAGDGQGAVWAEGHRVDGGASCGRSQVDIGSECRVESAGRKEAANICNGRAGEI